MNLQNFRALLKPIGDRFWPGLKVHEAPAFFWRCDGATYEALGEGGQRQVDEYVCHHWYIDVRRNGAPLPTRQPIQRLPFQRFILRIDDEVIGETRWRLIVQRPDVLLSDDVTWGLIDGADSLVAISTEITGCTRFDVWDTHRSGIRTDDNARAFASALFQEALSWGERHGNSPDIGDNPIEAWRHYKAVELRPFLFELFHPANHLVKVAPQQDGRSVEWHEARAHFLILDRHSMSHVRPSGGRLTEAEHNEAIRRAAHRRRAHTRVLRHPKWGARVGVVVFVKSTWVGPKKWEGPDGKTYVLVDRKPSADRNAP